MYLGYINDYVIDNDRYSNKILLITSKKGNIRNKTDLPTIEHWLEIMREIYNVDKND